jgi:HSP20 family protein
MSMAVLFEFFGIYMADLACQVERFGRPTLPLWQTRPGILGAQPAAVALHGAARSLNHPPTGGDLIGGRSMLTTRSLNSTLDRMLTLNRALDEAFSSTWNDSRVWVPAIDVVEKKDAYQMYAELPGVDPSQIDISFEQNVLTIRGAKRASIEAGNEGEFRVYAAERVTGAFERSIRLPEFVDGEHISAEFNNGLLIVSVPKAQAAQPRRIEIQKATHRPAEISNVTENGTAKTAAN